MMRRYRIMIIEDDVSISDLLKDALEPEGYLVSRAYSGTEALLLLERERPDLVLLDLMLPGLTGEEVLPLIKEIEKSKTIYALRQLQLKYADFGYGVPFGAYFGADEKNAKMNILNINQGGLTLGQKEYYLDNDSATAAIRDAYKKHIVKMFKLFGYSQKAATLKMNDVLDIETKIARISKSRTELRDVESPRRCRR